MFPKLWDVLLNLMLALLDFAVVWPLPVITWALDMENREMAATINNEIFFMVADSSSYFNVLPPEGETSADTVPLIIKSVLLPLSNVTCTDFWKKPGRPSVP